MRKSTLTVIAALLAVLYVKAPVHALLLHGGGNSVNNNTVALTRTFNNPSGSATGSTAFWTIGYPFKTTATAGAADLPSGTVITGCTLGGTSVPCSLVARKVAQNGDIEWGQLLVDFSGAPISGNSGATLQLTTGTGSWPGGSGFGNSAWDALGDKVTLSSLSNAASSVAASVQGSGTWAAAFNGDPTNSVKSYGDSPQGLFVEVTAYLVDQTALANFSSASWTSNTETVNFSTAPSVVTGDAVALIDGSTIVGICDFKNGAITVSGNAFTCTTSNPGTVTSVAAIHRNMIVVMDYWATKKAGGSAGPVESWGPFIENMLLHPGVTNTSTLTQFTYTATFARGGSTIRGGSGSAYASLTTPGLAIGNMMRQDAQGDWSANDPGIWVSQSYASVVNTMKVPPFEKGITGYTGVPLVSNITGFTSSTLTIDSFVPIMSSNSGQVYPEPVEFGGSSVPGGLSAGTLYWAVLETTTTISVYDNLADALTNGSTGRKTLTSAGTSATVEIDEAPGGTGQFDLGLGDTSGRPDISITTEWGAGYLVGNTQAFQRVARIMAYDVDTSPIFGINAATGKILSFMDSGNTPAGLNASGGYVNNTLSNYGICAGGSNNINGGSAPAGGCGGWNWSGSAAAHMPNAAFIPFVMEGVPFLQDIMTMQANGIEAFQFATTTAGRNTVVNSTTYYGSVGCVFTAGNIRRGAWHMRDVGEAAWVALNGSDEETYFRNVLTENVNECGAQQTFYGANYTNNGLAINAGDLPTGVGNTVGNPGFQGFMEGYLRASYAWIDLLNGDYVTSFAAQISDLANFLVYVDNGNSSGYCGYFSVSYYETEGNSDYGSTAPATFIPSLADRGVNTMTLNFNNSSASQTVVTATPWLQNGDIIRLTNYETDGSNFGQTPAPTGTGFSTNTDYYVVNYSGGSTLGLATTSGGSAVTSTAAVNGVWGVALPPPSRSPCPSGTQQSNTGADSYVAYDATALAIMSELGIAHTGTAYTNAIARWSFSCSGAMRWCMAPP